MSLGSQPMKTAPFSPKNEDCDPKKQFFGTLKQVFEKYHKSADLRGGSLVAPPAVLVLARVSGIVK